MINLPESNSFFLFGARGTGKSTLFEERIVDQDSAWVVDLLNPEVERELLLHPMRLLEQWKALPSPKPKWVVLDEIQKVPKLLDVVHLGIEKEKIQFAMTGSSARKLRAGASNLLAGRAFVYSLFPLCAEELGEDFNLQSALEWGTLPSIFQYEGDADRERYLNAYTQTYLREEIRVEQAVRQLEPFLKFLDVAAQSNTKVINHSKIARDAKIDPKNSSRYFKLLEDSLLGFSLEPYHRSVRKRQVQRSKFYFVDSGIVRSLTGSLRSPLRTGTSAYGEAFEHWVVLEIVRLNAYLELGFRLSYLLTKDGAEIDLLLEKGQEVQYLIEIKSSSDVADIDLKHLEAFGGDFPNAQAIVLSRETQARKVGEVSIYPWQQGLREIFGTERQ